MWEDPEESDGGNGPNNMDDKCRELRTRVQVQSILEDRRPGRNKVISIFVPTLILSLLLISSCLSSSVAVATGDVLPNDSLDRSANGHGETDDLKSTALDGSGTGGPGYRDAMRFFIENRGQFNGDVRFVAVTEFGKAIFYDSKVQYCLERSEGGNVSGTDLITLTFPGSELVCPLGQDLQPHYTNYFVGDPSTWVSGAKNFDSIVYQDLWPGIDLAYHFDAKGLKYEFISDPYASEGLIGILVEGASVHADPTCLTFDTGNGYLIDSELVVTQAKGARVLSAGFRTIGNLITFDVEGRDRSMSLVIDPLLYSTYVGGSEYDFCQGIAVDGAGNVYVTGQTQSTNFPMSGPFQAGMAGGSDAFVLKLKEDGESLIYSTYIGGSGGDYGQDIAIDGNGNAYIVGSTSSTNFPTFNPVQSLYGGGNYDAFVLKLDTDGNALVYSTYIGGGGEDVGNAIAVDGGGNAFVVGYTSSNDFPMANALQTANAGYYDSFVLKINIAGNALIYSTYVGGGDTDNGQNIAVDGGGNVYLTGLSYSTDFPTQNPYQSTIGGGSDAFVLKLDPTGSEIIYSTYIGGSLADYGQGLAIDAGGNAYVVGSSGSSNFPVTFGTFQSIKDGGGDTFVLKLNPMGNGLVYSTFVGGGNDDVGLGIALDGSNNAYITGYTNSSDFPMANAFQASYGGDIYDAFLLVLNAAGTALMLSTFFGGEDTDAAYQIALDDRGDVFIGGGTYSMDFPILNALQPNISGDCDGFVLKLDLGGIETLHSTYIGGSDEDQAESIAIDTFGNLYIAGYSYSDNFPNTTGAFQVDRQGQSDVFILKLDPAGDDIIYSTYVGGSWDDQAIDIAVDASGNAYVTGYTYSLDFPTAGPFQAANGGYYDAFVLKLNPTGNALIYSTYIGGSDTDFGLGIAIDGAGNSYITGGTFSLDFPTANPLMASNSGGCDIFMVKLNVLGNDLIYSTYIGGGSDDQGKDIAIAASGDAYVTGDSNSTDLPTASPLYAANGGEYDAFVLKLNAAGSALVFSTYIGGGGDDHGNGIALDALGDAYVTGDTNSTDFPLSAPFQAIKGDLSDAFALKIDPSGVALIYSTYIGGDDIDIGYHIAVDIDGNANIIGYTYSNDFPTASAFQSAKGGDFDAFVLKLSTKGNTLVYSTYVGGSDSDYGLSIAIGPYGGVFVTGGTYSIDFPVHDPFQTSNAGDEDLFVLRLGLRTPPTAPLDLIAAPGNGHVQLSWSPPTEDGGSPVDYYVVYKNGVDVAHPGITYINITGLNNEVSYSFVVAAHNALGLGVLSQTVTAAPTTLTVVPGIPTNFVVKAGDAKVTLSWSPPLGGDAGIDYYIVYVNGTDVKHSTTLSTEVLGLVNGVEYSFQVAAHNAIGNGPETEVEHAMPDVGSTDDSGGFDLLIILGVVAAMIIVSLVAVFVVRGKKARASKSVKPPEPVPPPMPAAPIPPPIEAIKYCPWCGERAGEEFCGNCGRKVS